MFGLALRFATVGFVSFAKRAVHVNSWIGQNTSTTLAPVEHGGLAPDLAHSDRCFEKYKMDYTSSPKSVANQF